jgi:hypothetical protein
MKKLIQSLALMLVLLSAWQVSAQTVAPLGVTVSPSSVQVSRGRAATLPLIYTFRGDFDGCSLVSAQGQFLSELMNETNPVPLVIPVNNGIGSATETLTIPVRVIEKVIAGKETSFIYQREFIGCDAFIPPTTVTVRITTEAGADFNINRIALFFENRRPEITVNRNYPNLKAYAELQFTGSGLLQGYWEVDGRIISRVNQHLTYGRSIKLQSPDIPSLPTFDEGSHIVRFVITAPATTLPLPEIVYFVTPEESKKIAAIRLGSPEDKAEVPLSSLKLEWEGISSSELFLIVFYSDLETKPVFSAYTRQPYYSVPEPVMNGMFAPGQKYFWKVMSFDSENKVTGESELWSFSFQK